MKTAAILGIPPAAMPAWIDLCNVLDRMRDNGRVPVCTQRPDDWADDAKVRARSDAAEACTHCPALAACEAYATAAGERHHVWAGVDRSLRPAKGAAA